jgi:anaphase-promoting complex subunit 7
LALRPFDSRLALALSEAQRACGESDAAIQTLRVHLETYASAETRARVACHCALGAALASARMLADAAGEYQRACGLDAECEPAKRGLARVERLMKGQDPDARDDVDEDEDDGGGDEEDDEGDEEEDEGDLFE